MSILNFAAGRLNTIPLDLRGNANKILQLCNEAHKQGYKFVAFPELSITGYACGDLFNHAELQKAAVKVLLEIKYALEEDFTVGVGIPLLGSDGKTYDAYVLMEKGKILGVSVLHSFYNSKDARVRFFTTPFDESLSFYIGAQVYQVTQNFTIDGKKTAICFNDGDLPFVDDDCEVMVCPEATRFELYDTQLRLNKIVELSDKYQRYVMTTNLLGCESGSDIFDGLCVFAHKGQLLAISDILSFKESSLVSEKSGVSTFIDENDVIVRAVALGLYDWMKKTHAHGFALSMSGGADSGLCATCVAYGQLAALHDLGFDGYKALMQSLKFEVPDFTGDKESYIKTYMMPQVLTTVYQGSAVSSSVTRTAAAKVSENLGAKHFEWSIAKLVEDYVGLVNDTTPGDPLTWERDDLTLQNIQARCRAPSIWMIANRYNKLLITTSNASEGAVGYCTMDGDTAGGVAPIGDISKSRILRINQHIADNGIAIDASGLKLNVPNMSYISAQAPTAELRPGGNQTDERDLMPYVILDRIAVLHQEEMQTPKQILEVLKEEYSQFSKDELVVFVKRYFTKLATNQWKRERGATTFHIEKTDLNAKSGFIFPLLNDGYKSLLEDLDK
ncbi:MAG: NAD(+) synthase [Aeromonadales bacterium]|nr:NAD(+) synthase [Aeromonadales bacterium]